MLANIHRNEKHHPDPFRPTDFIPIEIPDEPAEEPQFDPEEVSRRLKQMLGKTE